MPLTDSFLNYEHTNHAMRCHGLDDEIIREALAKLEKHLPVCPGWDVLQSRRKTEGMIYLIRVFADMDQSPAKVVADYRTKMIDKYWREES